MAVKCGDYVTRRSYREDVIFRVKQIFRDENDVPSAVLKGVEVRLIADSPLLDLCPAEIGKLSRFLSMENLFSSFKTGGNHSLSLSKEGGSFDYPGMVLHLDGDKEYLEKSIEGYEKLGIPHVGFTVPERDQADAVSYYLERYRPDILVLTGHDSLLRNAKDQRNLDHYRTSFYFVDAVRKARQYQPDRDALIIFAGACQSCYEELIRAGANYASSPRRVFIHVCDPVLLIEKLAFTSIKEVLSVEDALSVTVSGESGIGGIETRGCFRRGYPRIDKKVIRV